MIEITQAYRQQPEEVLTALQTSPNGLSRAEVERRLAQHGPNQIERHKRKTTLQILLDQARGFMVLILFISLGISIAVGEILDAALLGVVIAINIIAGFVLESKAEQAFEALEKMTVDTAHVVRDGKDAMVDAQELVPGDIVVFEEGERLPADLRLLEVHGLQVDESILTGESVPSTKQVEPIEEEVTVADMESMGFAGTTVTAGLGKGVVVATGMNMELGRISDMVEEAVVVTPLQKRLDTLGKILLVLSAGLAAVIFVTGLARGEAWVPLLIYVISLTVSAVPEALPTVTTLSLGMGAIGMADRNAIVRNLPILETLGSVDTICSDKTGTITKNEMTVRRVLLHDDDIQVEGIGYRPEGRFLLSDERIDPSAHPDLQALLRAVTLCNAASLTTSDDGADWDVVGDPTEGALLVLARKAGVTAKTITTSGSPELVHAVPFTSARRMRVAVHQVDGELLAHVVGAPERILQLSTQRLAQGTVVPLEDAWRAEVDARFDELASQGYRLLAAAYRPLAESFVPEEAETALTFIGVVAMMDPPKAGVAEAVAEAKGAGIRPVMITGDHILTAQAIGREVGITGEALQGLDVARMDDAELAAAVEEVEIFARTSPEHKVRIVNALLDLGHTVAVTGDGVNDAPVLKAADVGISMGIQGSDVAREAADLILTDDNFATIVAAVRYGRGIYDNLKNFFLFSLLGNFDELYLVIVAFLLGLPFPLTALQILWINLLTDAFAGLALAFEPPRAEVLHDKPRNPHASMLKPVIGRAATYGLLALIFELLFFLTGLGTSVAKARTLVFTFCVFFELVAIFSIRTEKRFDLKVQNRWLILAVVVSVVFQLVAIYSPLRHVLEVVPLTLGELGTVVGTSLLSYVLMEIVKLVILKRQKG